MYLVSACLAGINCKYNGKNNYNKKIVDLVREGKAIPVCPEQLGGLKTPRLPSEIKHFNGKRYVINVNNEDVTCNFEKGALETLSLAKTLKIDKAILKSKSPSCGFGKIYSGNFDNKLVEGNGITTELLLKNGVIVISSEEF